MNKRKLFGTIIGLIFWSICVVFFTYAYYDWKSAPTNVVLGIEDLSVECVVGADVSATNIGPVLNYQDGIKAEFSINNIMSDNMAIELYLDITSISDVSLLTESLKYSLVSKNVSSNTYDYSNPIIEGNFSNFDIGNNLITYDLEVTASTTTNYQFIIYIDGNMYNNIDMQENSINANLLIGNCGEDALPYDELVYQAIYSETDNSLTFVHTTPLTVGDTYNDKVVTAVYTGFETANYTSASNVPWYSNRENITSVIFDSVIKPKSTASWFYEFKNLTDIDLTKLDTSNVNNMVGMFYGCSSLLELDLSNFDTSNVTNFANMFSGCSSLLELDVSNFDTSKVTSMTSMFSGCSKLTTLYLNNLDTTNVTNMSYMFNNCNGLTFLDLSSFDTSKVTIMNSMFNGCSSLLELDVSSFDTSNVTNMSKMFWVCKSLTSLDLSNFDTRNVGSIAYMFEDCSNLTSLDVSSFDTSKVTDMGFIFSGLTKITELDLDGWDTSKVTNMMAMFQNCYNLTATITIRNANVTNYSAMLRNTSTSARAKLTLNYTIDTSDLVDSMVATNSNVVKGTLVS